MKIQPIVIILLLSVTAACKSIYIFPQSKADFETCKTSSTGVNVRIKNSGHLSFSKFILKVNGQDLEFKGLKKGEVSCFKNISYLWTSNSSELWFYTDSIYGRKFLSVAVDHVGEKKIDSGSVTIEIAIRGTIKKPKYQHWLTKN